MFTNPAITCQVCHTVDFEILRSERYGFVVVCNECGYACGATLQHLAAS